MKITPCRWMPGSGEFEQTTETADAAFVLYFGPNPVISDPRFLAGIRERCPTAHILGCTTGTLIDGADLQDDAALFVAATLDRTTVRLSSADVSVETSRKAGRRIGQELHSTDLVGVFVLCDSLHVDGAELLAGLRDHLGLDVPISGGLASDGSAFEHTLVGADGPPAERLAAAIGFYGSSFKMSQGCAHGWDDFGPPRTITRAQGNTLYELDGKPALDLYERYLGDDAAELPSSALRFPLLISNPADPTQQVVRTVLDVDKTARTLTFASSIQDGWTARLMRGALDRLADGAAAAASEAAGSSIQDQGGLAILVSCVGRRIVFGQSAADETEAVASILSPRLQQFGFYSHGEIASANSDSFCGLHNQTMTIVTMQEAA
jgi:hypothetical protein